VDNEVVRYVKYTGKGPSVVAGVFMDTPGKIYKVDLSHAKLERLLNDSIAKGDVSLAKAPAAVPEEPVADVSVETPEAKPARSKRKA